MSLTPSPINEPESAALNAPATVQPDTPPPGRLSLQQAWEAEKARLASENEKPSEEPPQEESQGESAETLEFNHPRLGKLTAEDIEIMSRAANELVEMEKAQKSRKGADQHQMTRYAAAMSRLQRLMADNTDLAAKITEALGDDAEEFNVLMSGDADTMPSGSNDGRSGRDQEDDLDPEDQARREWIDRQMYEQARTDVQTVVSQFAAEYPDLVKNDQAWMKNVLAPEVRKRFGEDVTLDHLRMTLADLVHLNGAVKKAREQGRKDVTESLKNLPAGAQVVQAGGNRSQAAPPEPDWKKMDRKSVFATIAERVMR